jgi:hypothetical protein
VEQGIDKNDICTLRLIAKSLASSRYRVDVKSVGIDGAAPVRVEFDLPLDDARRERSRWYFEECLQYPLDPAPAMAAADCRTVEGVRRAAVPQHFRSHQGRTAIVGGVRRTDRPGAFELHAAGDQSAALPWELMQDPKTGLRPAIAARAFVRCTRRKIDRRGDQRRDGAGASGDFAALRGTGCAVSGGGGTAVGLAQ